MKLKKAIKEITVQSRRSLLVIIALIIGMTGFGSVIVSYSILSRDLKTNYLQTKPAHVVLESKEFKPSDIELLRQNPEIESAEFRGFKMLRIEVYKDEWIPLWLFGVDDFSTMQLALFAKEEGASIPTKGNMLIERNGMLISNLKIGTGAKVKGVGKINTVLVDGITFDPAQAPATQDHFIYGYVDKETFQTLTGEAFQHRLVVRFNKVSSKEEVSDKTKALIAQLKTQKINVDTYKIPEFNEHPHQWQLDTLMLLVGSIGFLSFIMSGILVYQLMAAMLSSQVREIGILKAIGGSRRQIFTIYFFMLLLFGAVASLAAVPLSLFFGSSYSQYVARILNFNIITHVLPLPVYVLLISFSIFLPALLSYNMIWRKLQMSVNEAINDYGIQVETKRENKFTYQLKFLYSLFPNTWILAFRNIFRKKARLIILVISMGMGVAIFNTGFNVRQSLSNLIGNVHTALQYDIQVVLEKPVSMDEATKLFSEIEGLDAIEGWNSGSGVMQSNQVSTDNEIGIIALPYDSDLLKLKIVDGTWLNKEQKFGVVINQQAIDLLGTPKLGDNLSLSIHGNPHDYKLIGIAESFDEPKIYMDQTTYQTVSEKNNNVNNIMLVSKNRTYEQVREFKKSIEKLIEAKGIDVLYVMSQSERVKIIFDHLNIILTVILFLAFLVLLVSGMGMSLSTNISIIEREKEIFVMNAIGATPKKIAAIFIIEGMIISIGSIVVGLILAQPLSSLASVFFGNLLLGEQAMLRYSFNLVGLLVTLLITLTFGYFASRSPIKQIKIG